jgi:hypothetical protein
MLGLVVSVGLFSVASSGANAAEQGSCPVTKPGSDRPGADPFGPGSFNYGNARIRTQIWPNGNLIAGRLPSGGDWAEINPDGSSHAKLGWWRGVPGNLTITGHRIDAPAAALRADIPPTNELQQQGSGPHSERADIPTVGCWRIVGTQAGTRRAFVVKVTKIEQNS